MSRKGNDVSQRLASLESNLGQAKRDLVMRFVRDQETLQTSQVDLKLVDDETIDLIDSASVANEEEAARNDNERASSAKHVITEEYSLDRGVSKMRLEGEEKRNKNDHCPEPPIAPRPPSGRPQSRRRKKSASATDLRTKRKVSTSKSSLENLEEKSNPPATETRYSMESPFYDSLGYDPNLDATESGGLNSSWPQEFLARKFFTGSQLRKYAICSPDLATASYGPVDSFSGMEQYLPDGVRPTSTQSLRHVGPREMIAARVRKHSASDSARITCNIKPLIRTNTSTDSPSKMGSKSLTRSRTIFNFGFEGPLELEPVHPSELSMLRSASASGSSSGPYALVQLPPIARETPAATPPSS